MNARAGLAVSHDESAAQGALRCCAMQQADLPQVMALERLVYPWPWTEGNMRDSLAQGHWCQVLRDDQARLLAYCVAMIGAQEAHLLNITVAPAQQGQGLGRLILNDLSAWARDAGALSIWLEVRKSNARAAMIYEKFGFSRVGLRKAYYPMGGSEREDALVMNLSL